MITLDVTSFYAAGAGGIRTYYRAKAQHLPPRGHECHFVVPGPRRSTERFGLGWLHRIPGPPLDRGARYRAFADLRALHRLLDDIRPDVVELGSHYVLPQLLAPALRATPTVGFYHADVPTTYVAPLLRRAPRLQSVALSAAWAWVRAQHRRYRATLAASRYTADALRAHRVPAVRHVGLGVDLDAFRPGPAGPSLGYLGRLSADKELPLLLAAAPALRRLTSAPVVVAGDGPLARSVLAAHARGDIDYRGVLPPADVPPLLSSLAALIVPGRYESFGLAAAEALACGVPIVAPDRGGAAELVAASSAGACFAAGDASALVAAARAVLASRAALSSRARAYAERSLGWGPVMARIESIYDEVRC